MSAAKQTRQARILEITSYPPPRAGWGVRVEFLKHHLEANGHECVVLNIGKSRNIPSSEYETVLGAGDYVRKVWRFCRAGFTTHVHINGSTPKGLVLTIGAQIINLLFGRRTVLTFHAGVKQVYFPRSQAPMLCPVFWLMFTMARSIICNNEAVKAKIQEYWVPARKIHPIPAFSRQYLDAQAESLDDRIEAFYARYRDIVFTYVRVRDGFYLETLIDGFARVARRRADVGLVICGVAGDINPVLWKAVQRLIAVHDLSDRICIVDDLPHERFLTAVRRAALYLRTPTSDGVASSVLEALAMRVPVVAAENGTRPAGTINYAPTDGQAMADAVLDVLSDRKAAIAAIPPVAIRDTLDEEATLLAAS